MSVSPPSPAPLLAEQPSHPPQFSVPLKTSKGEKIEAADPKVTRALIALMDMNAVIGGAACHYGGPAAFAELMSAAHAYMFFKASQAKKKWFELFNFVNDAGHCENGLYALKANYKMAGLDFNALKKFRSIESPLTGHGESHLFPQGVYLSNGPLGSAFPQSQGLAMADRLSGLQRVTVTAISDGACMEGEARESLAAIPGLAKNGKLAPFVLVISDNNTKLTGRIDKDAFSMNPTFAALESLGWRVLHLEDGHDLQACLIMFERAVEDALREPHIPIAIHAKTVKGKGNKKAVDSASGGHGFSLKSSSELPQFLAEIFDDQPTPPEFKSWCEELTALEAKKKSTAEKPAVPEEKIQVGIAKAMIKARQAGLPVVSVTSDLPGSTGVSQFHKEFPQFSFDVGVAEANMVSTAAGFSKAGYIPFVDTFAQFGVTKGALPLLMGSLSQAPVIAVYSHTGFQDAADGASHQSLTYISMLASIPHVDLYCLSCSEEAEALVSQVIQNFVDQRKKGKVPHSAVFFLGRENFPKNFVSGASYDLHRSQVVFDELKTSGKNAIVATTGSLVGEAIASAQILKKEGWGIKVINVPCVNHPDLAPIKEALKTKAPLFTLEDHQLTGGFGSLLCHALKLDGVEFDLKSLGVKGEFGQSAYNAIDLYRKHRIDGASLARQIMEWK